MAVNVWRDATKSYINLWKIFKLYEIIWSIHTVKIVCSIKYNDAITYRQINSYFLVVVSPYLTHSLNFHVVWIKIFTDKRFATVALVVFTIISLHWKMDTVERNRKVATKSKDVLGWNQTAINPIHRYVCVCMCVGKITISFRLPIVMHVKRTYTIDTYLHNGAIHSMDSVARLTLYVIRTLWAIETRHRMNSTESLPWQN